MPRIALIDDKGKVVYAATIEPPEGVSLADAMPVQGDGVTLVNLDDVGQSEPVVYGDTWDGKKFSAATHDHVPEGYLRQWSEEATDIARETAATQ